MKPLIISAIALALLSGCSSKDYYEQQPKRDSAEGERVVAIGEGLEKVVAAFRRRADQRVAHRPNDKSAQTEIEFSDAAIAESFENRIPYDAEVDRLEAPVEGTGQAIIIHDQPAEINRGVYRRTRGQSPQQPAESLLLQYIMLERKAAAEQAAAAEETKQLKEIMAAYTNAVLKKQPEQAAPYTGKSTMNKVADALPLLGTIMGMNSLGKAGIAGAIGDTSSNPVTTIIKNTTTNSGIE